MKQPLRILVIDDNPGDRDLVRLGLGLIEGREPLVRDAATLQQALQLLRDEPADLIILDLGLPDSAGLPAFDAVHDLCPQTPIVVLTGLEDESHGDEAIRRGAEDYLRKDELDDRRLTRAVRFAFERSRRRQADERLRLNESDFRIAREIQFNLSPFSPPRLPGYDLAGGAFAADTVGGDYFDYLPLADRRWGLIVGDAAGHGLGPSVLMAETRTCLHTLASIFDDPGAILARANQVLGTGMPRNRFVTLLLVALDPLTRRLHHCGAGHPPGLILDRLGHIRQQLLSEGLPLGVVPDATYHTLGPSTLEPGDTLFLYSDGAPEAGHLTRSRICEDELAGMVAALLHLPASEIVQSLYEAILREAPDGELLDDVTLVIVKALD
jgi:serine phosphatase RsbU (regulator of sigma subunit)